MFVLNSLERLLSAIDYPSGEVASSGSVLSLHVDDGVVKVEERDGQVIFTRALGSFAGRDLADMAAFALGRLLKEEATLAWDPETNGLILWQGIGTFASDRQLRQAFELFLTSCDWWLARVGEKEQKDEIPSMVIRP